MNSDSGTESLYDSIWPGGSPVRNLPCRHCGVKNRINVGRAALKPSSCLCGKCNEPLFLSPTQALSHLSPKSYQHSLDKKALATLESIPGMSALVRWFLHEIGERPLRYHYLASSVLVSENQFPELLTLLKKAQVRLGIAETPTLFLTQSPVVNASTFGSEEPTIVINSGILDHLDDPASICVLGHELGHIHSEHSVYKILAAVLMQGGTSFGVISKLLSAPLQFGLQKWSRCAELTADRAGLLACGRVESVIDVLMRLAGGRSHGVADRATLRVGPFVEQARQLSFVENDSWLDGAVANWMTVDRSHPFAAWRLLEILEWVEHGNYLDILSGQYVHTSPLPRLEEVGDREV